MAKLACKIQSLGIGTASLKKLDSIPKLDFEDTATKFKCCIFCNHILMIHASSLILTYTKYDERFRLLAFFVKEWARNNNILGNAHLSSYAYTLLLIHYLQNADPPLLPPLQKLFLSKPEGFSQLIPFIRFEKDTQIIYKASAYYEQKIEKVRAYMKDKYESNISSLGVLLCGFFQYYAHIFNVSIYIIQIIA